MLFDFLTFDIEHFVNVVKDFKDVLFALKDAILDWIPQFQKAHKLVTFFTNEAIVITVSGIGFETWSVVSSYYRVENQFIFQPAREVINPGGEVELLGDWTGKTGAA